jgi:TP901 family phage tail tape measure protein
MAEDQVRTRITADADFSNLIADVHKVTASLSKLQEKIASSNKMLANQIAVMNRSFSDTLRSTGQFSTHFVSLNSDVEKFGRQLDSGQLKLNKYYKTMQDHTRTSGGLIRDLAKQQVALQNAIIQPLGRNAQGLMQFNVQVPRGLDEVKNKAAIARQELQIMNKVVQQGAGQLINWGKNTQWAGRQLSVGLTLPIAAFGKAAADAFRTADKELVRLTKVYGDTAGSTAEELGKIRSEVEATAKSLAKNLGASYRETLALGADIAATGQTGQKLIASIEETTRLAVLGEVDRAEAMKATLAIQSAFKQNTEELTESINFLNAVENQTSTSLADLVEAIPKAGPVIQGLGGSVQDLALYLTAMREGGINASEGANALKSGLASLINPTKQSIGQFKEFGIDLLAIVNENAGSTTDMILGLQAALDTLDPLKKQQAIENLFGKFQFARMNALFENLGKQGSQTLQVLDLMQQSTQDLGALADRELAAVTESASGRYSRAVEGLKAELASIGESFLNINTTLINVVTKILDFVSNMPKPLKQVLTLFGGLTAIAGPLIMLTGVLANFFGYIVKGVFHMKALLKGGEGWKYLTPEILAAEKAGSLIEQTLYSDAKAAGVLQLALRNLIDEFSVLEAKAASGSISVAPAVRTMAGNLVQQAGAGARVVDKNHPLVGPSYSRASSHMNPRGMMSETERLNQTFFGMVPGSIPVNQKIGANPQIYAESDLPNIPGLTRINGVSTGVVAAEAAKHHSMMAALGMQSQAEIAALKASIASTGVATQQFMSIFDDILPAVTAITRNAAVESRAIVAQLEAGALNVQQARAQIIALNSRTEALIAQTTMAQAAGMGRTLNPTMIPTLNQPVVSASGKSNMRELFKKSKTRDFIDKIARNLGVRTSGAGYNIETTIPKRFNTGNIVPGTGNTDTVPAMLTPGEFVVNKEATAANLPLLHAINGGKKDAGYENMRGGFMSPNAANAVLRMFGVSSRSAKAARLVGNWGMLLPNAINRRLRYGRATGSELIPHVSNSKNLIDVERFLSFKNVDPSDIRSVQSKIAADMKAAIDPSQMYGDPQLGRLAFAAISPNIKSLESKYPGISLAYQKDRMSPGRRDTLSSSSKHGPSPTGISVPGGRASSYGSGSGKGSNRSVWAHFGDEEFDQNIGMLAQGFNAGGQVGNVLKSTAFKNIGAKFGKIGDKWGATSLAIGMGKKLFGSSGLTPKAQNLMYGKLVENLEKERPYGYVKDAQGHLKNALEPHVVDILIKSAAGDVLSSGGKSLSKIDREILRTKFANWDNKSWTPSTSKVRKQMFGMNKGGMVPGYNRGGLVSRYRSLRSGVRGTGTVRAPQLDQDGNPMPIDPNSGMASSMAGMGLLMGGSMIQGTAGQGMQFAGMAMQMAPLLKMIGPMIKGMGTFTGILAKLKTVGVATFTALRIGIAALMGPVGLVSIGIGALIAGYKVWQDNLKETRRETALLNGMTKKGAAEAGISYETITEKLKRVNAELKLQREKGMLSYEASTSSGVSGLTVTIAELKELKKTAKETMPELLGTFNSIDSSKVNDLAANLKAQFVAGGMSVQEATNKIYALIEASNKVGQGFEAISQKGFQQIIDKSSAASFTIKALSKNLEELNAGTSDIDSAAFSGNVDAVITSLDAAVRSLVGTKDATGEKITETKALQMQYKKLIDLGVAENQLGEKGLQNLKKENPILASILKTTDTIGGMYAKWRLSLAGVQVDLRNINSETAIGMAMYQDALSLAGQQIAEGKVASKSLGAAATASKKLGKEIKSGADLIKKASDSEAGLNRAAIKRINDKIAAIKKEADAKKKAMSDALEAENTELELQKLQLESQAALARGDRDGYAQAQLSIAQLTKEMQAKQAIARVDALEKKELEAQQKLLDDDAERKAKQQDAITAAGKTGEKKVETQNQIDDIMGRFLALAQRQDNANKLKDPAARTKATNEITGDRDTLLKELEKASDAVQKAFPEFVNAVTNKRIADQTVPLFMKNGGQQTGGAGAAFTSLVSEMSTQANANYKAMVKDLGGGATLKDVVKAMGGSVKSTKSLNTSDVLAATGDKDIGTAKKGKAAGDKEGDLTDLARKRIIEKYKLNENDTFTFDDRTYRVTVGHNAWGGFKDGKAVVQREAGGRVIPGKIYSINEGMKTEGIKFDMPATIYPNINTAPKFDIPNSSINGMRGVSNTSSSNSVYNVNIELNGTNITADDVMRKFKQELTLMGAKEGRVRTVGGYN